MLKRYKEAGLTMPLLWPPFADVPISKTHGRPQAAEGRDHAEGRGHVTERATGTAGQGLAGLARGLRHATVIRTRTRADPDLTPQVRAWFADHGFAELGFDTEDGHDHAVGTHVLRVHPSAYRPGRRMFQFV